jgi:hypothetical protein
VPIAEISACSITPPATSEDGPRRGGRNAVGRPPDPDYRRSRRGHAELVTTLYAFLMEGPHTDAWFAAQVDKADCVTGDIDTLSGRIAQIRTWTSSPTARTGCMPRPLVGDALEVENKLSGMRRMNA